MAEKYSECNKVMKKHKFLVFIIIKIIKFTYDDFF